jgi:hypothetical protein
MSAQCPKKRRETAKALRREFGITIDGRSRQAQALRRFRAQLVEHVGGQPTVTEEALISSICQLRLRLLALDESFARLGRMTETDSRHYRGWVQSFHKALLDLGLKEPPAAKPSWNDVLASLSAPEGAHEGDDA